MFRCLDKPNMPECLGLYGCHTGNSHTSSILPRRRKRWPQYVCTRQLRHRTMHCIALRSAHCTVMQPMEPRHCTTTINCYTAQCTVGPGVHRCASASETVHYIPPLYTAETLYGRRVTLSSVALGGSVAIGGSVAPRAVYP
jgi:hypothetical protein